MKTRILLLVPALLVAVQTNADPPRFLTASEPAVVERGPHHAIWQRFSQYLTSYGRVLLRTNSYVELATGLNYQKDWEWVPTREEIELFGNGAIARQGQHQVIFSPNINTIGAIDVLMPNGQRLLSRILGLAYYDAASGKSVLIAETKDSIGQLIASNQLLYEDAFQGVKADVRCTYTKAAFESDVILRERPLEPTTYGLNSESTRLEVWTEFFDPPAPRKEAIIIRYEANPRLRRAMVQPDFIDERLEFGDMMFGRGLAFSTAHEPQDDAIPVGKAWVTAEGRTFLVESVEYSVVLPLLKPLPTVTAVGHKDWQRAASLQIGGSGPRLELATLFAKTPVHATAGSSQGSIQVALGAISKASGLVLDYVLMNSVTNFTFRGDSTYYVSSAVTLSGTTVIEGGTVIKYTNYPANLNAKLYFTGPVDCQTGPFRPALFTSKDDNTVGEVIAGSTGNPTGYYARRALDLNYSGYTFNLHDLRVRYAFEAIFVTSGSSMILRHSQIGYGDRAIGNYTSYCTFHNLLFHNLVTGFFGYAGATNRGEHVTMHQVSTLTSGASQLGTNAVVLTNTLLLSVTNSLNFAGSSVVTNLDSTGVFQTIGGGARYLAPISPYRNSGTTNIAPALLTDLKRRTTFPPILFFNDITNDTVLSPRITRDNDAPDLGYHYDTLDYLTGGITVSNATLYVLGGAAIAFDAAATNWGLRLASGGALVSEGTPTNLNIFVRTHGVQELPLSASPPGVPLLTDVYPAPASASRITLRFTDVPQLNGTYFAHEDRGRGTVSCFSLQNSSLRGGYFYLSPSVTNQTVGWTNNLFERVGVELYAYAPMDSFLFNNLFREGTLATYKSVGNPWLVKDNTFDKTTIIQWSSQPITHDYNAYITNYGRFTPTASHDVILTSTNVAYQLGPLGPYYLATNSALINSGSRLASDAGLYHFTVTTNNVRETNSVVDIGFHYVGLSGGYSVDSDGDGLPDYAEDKDGDGFLDAGETSMWDIDTDYDGRSDREEFVEGTNPLDPNDMEEATLGHWRFNTASWLGEAGQSPLEFYNVQCVTSISGNGLEVNSGSPANLKYRAAESNGAANINCRQGTVRFLLKPYWSSGTGPGGEARLIEMGNWTSNATYGFWALSLNSQGTSMYFSTQAGGTNSTNAQAGVSLSANQWYQICLTYSPTQSAIYVNGTLVTTGYGVQVYPSASVRTAKGFSVGSANDGTRQAKGLFDELETFNYSKLSGVISREFQDADGDGLVYFDELYLNLDPFNRDTDGDGISDGNEDYDGDLLSNAAECSRYHCDPKVQKSVNGQVTDGEYFLAAPMAAAPPGTMAYLKPPTFQGNNLHFIIVNGDPSLSYDIYYTPTLNPGYYWRLYSRGAVGQSVFDVPNPLTQNAFFASEVGSDEDEDGLPDGYERLATKSVVGTVVYNTFEIQDGFKDSDGDGLSDAEEFNLGTDPFNADSDRDGVSDGPKGGSAFLTDGIDNDNDGLIDEPDEANIAPGTDPFPFEYRVMGKLRGDRQVGLLNSQLLLPLVVYLTNPNGTPVSDGQTVTFTALSPSGANVNGQLSNPSALTGANGFHGEAQSYFTLTSESGTYRVFASWNGNTFEFNVESGTVSLLQDANEHYEVSLPGSIVGDIVHLRASITAANATKAHVVGAKLTSSSNPQGLVCALYETAAGSGLFVGSAKINALYPTFAAASPFGANALENFRGPDAELEYCSADDVKNSAQSDYFDSDEFDLSLQFNGEGFVSRGKGRWTEDIPGGNVPPDAVPLTRSFVLRAGEELQAVNVNIMGGQLFLPAKNQADVFYFSGHGYHDENYFQLPNGQKFRPTDLSGGQWKEDLDIVIFAGCSLLDVTGDKVIPIIRDPSAKPGRYWAGTGPKYFLGYEWTAPLDSSGKPQQIADLWEANWELDFGDPISPWEFANRTQSAWNASAIDATGAPKTAWHFRKIFGSLYVWESVSELFW